MILIRPAGLFDLRNLCLDDRFARARFWSGFGRGGFGCRCCDHRGGGDLRNGDHRAYKGRLIHEPGRAVFRPMLFWVSAGFRPDFCAGFAGLIGAGFARLLGTVFAGLIRAAILTRAILTRAVVTGALLGLFRTVAVGAGPVISWTFGAGAVVLPPIVLAPVVLPSVVLAPTILRPVVAGAILRKLAPLRAGKFRQFNQSGILFTDHIKRRRAGGIGLIIAVIFTALVTVRAKIAVARGPVAGHRPIAISIAVCGLVLLLELLTLVLLGLHLTRGFCQKPCVMLGMLQKVFSRHTVVGQLRIPRQKLVFFDDLLRCATHLALGARAVKDAVDDVAEGARAVLLRTRAGL